MKTQNISIIGVRRMGTSIALALKDGPLDFVLTGHDSDPSILKEAGELGCFDKTESNLIRAAETADILVLSMPAVELKTTLQAIGDVVKPHALIIDLTELKSPGVKLAEQYLNQGHYVGAHPVLAARNFADGRPDTNKARADLFKNSVICVMPDATVDPQAVETAVNFGKLLGASPYFVDPMEYDSLIQGVETLPSLMAAALFRSINKASGWRDILRFADLPFAMSTMPLDTDAEELAYLALNDRVATLRWLDALVVELGQIRRWIQDGDEELLSAFFSELNLDRDRWLEERAKNDWVEGQDQPVNVPGMGERFFGGLARRSG
ncbi:MAG: prephenate dehydrogenase/arogenate dehydrogenase family protein [Candidatus Promineifilaceae bacterium]|nr:prephenate dehydrogenase/arogenate dehydrogenase family protein [Candidatus Promineifilaceae bacterium]